MSDTIKNIQESVDKWNILIEDIYQAVVGNELSGKIGLISQVRDIQARIKVLEESYRDYDNNSDKIKELNNIIHKIETLERTTTELKITVKNMNDTLLDIKPEIQDTKNKKLIIYGILIAAGAIWALIELIVPLFVK